MWQIDNRTPFAVERGWVRDRQGAEVWLVVVKCSFDIRPDGSTRVAAEQVPVLRLPEYHGEPGKSSLRCEADLVLAKTTTDVLVIGHAHAPDGRAVTELDVGFRVGPVRKMLRVHGDREWGALGASAPQAFSRMPLTYERAFGGVDRRSQHPERDWDWRNPVGRGFVVASRHAQGLPLPNVEYPDLPIRARDDRPPPAGFGPIASHWQPRASLAGTYDEAWQRTRQPLLPDDFDERFFQCAPADQQAPAFLHGGEPVMLYRLTPGGELRFELPRVFVRLETTFADGSQQLHERPHLHTVLLEPDVPRVVLVWHSALPCHFKVHQLRETLVTMKPLVRAGARRGPDDAPSEAVDDEADEDLEAEA